MSRSNNTEISNPAVRFFEWSSDEKAFKYYDKTAKKNVLVPLPFTFLVLDELTTITGWDDAAGSSYWSNEIKDMKTQKLVVRNKNGKVEEGLYEALQCLKSGAKYAKSLYIAFYDENSRLSIGNLKLMGSSLNWIDFAKANKANIYKKAVVVASTEEGKKGKTVFNMPVWGLKDVAEATNAAAELLDQELQAYLTAYFARNGQQQEAPQHSAPAEDRPVVVPPGSHYVDQPQASSASWDDSSLPF